ncbi:acyltransferase family protein [Hahella ganghwensis]|uniref:acyltransferase family protein n=1 Tax=Hahella ganghwensis TaxID=286420 RepID=UPI00039B78C4|nr:acyltransferase [Hahella ganghwensis]
MFLGYIHSFRALAIFFIVAGHAIDAFVWAEGSSLERALRIGVSNGSTLFVFIAGYLFQHLSAKYQTRKYMTNKFKNVILPYFFISIPAIAVFVTVIQRDSVWTGFYDNPAWLQIFYFYATGKHLAPLWFVPMIAIFYLVAPLLVRLDRQERIYYLLPVFLLISCFINRGLPLMSFVHFFSAYLLGMYCSHYKKNINPKLSQSNIMLGLGLLALILGIAEFYLMKGTMTYVSYLQKIALSLFFLGVFIRLGERLQSDFISIVADTSFGVFFIHSYILTSGKIAVSQLNGGLYGGNILAYGLVSVATLLLCVFLILVIKKILGGYSRYLVGS